MMGQAPSTSRPLLGPFPPLRILFLSFLPWGAFPYFSGFQPKYYPNISPSPTQATPPHHAE